MCEILSLVECHWEPGWASVGCIAVAMLVAAVLLGAAVVPPPRPTECRNLFVGVPYPGVVGVGLKMDTGGERPNKLTLVDMYLISSA